MSAALSGGGAPPGGTMNYATPRILFRNDQRIVTNNSDPDLIERLLDLQAPQKYSQSMSSEPVKELYTQLTEKLDAQKKSPPPPDETPSLDLGLHPVTVPTTASTPTTPL